MLTASSGIMLGPSMEYDKVGFSSDYLCHWTIFTLILIFIIFLAIVVILTVCLKFIIFCILIGWQIPEQWIIFFAYTFPCLINVNFFFVKRITSFSLSTAILTRGGLIFVYLQNGCCSISFSNSMISTHRHHKLLVRLLGLYSCMQVQV